MASLATIINAVGDDLIRTDLTSQCSDAVVMAIRYYDNMPWWFQESVNELTATATSGYTLTANFRQMEHVEVRLSNGTWSEVRPRDYPHVRRALESTSNGDPSIYAIHSNRIHFYQYPGGSDERIVRYYYTKSLTTLTASASNAWTSDCQDLIRASAAKTVAMRTLHDPELASVFAAIESTQLNRLMMENERRVTTGFATPRY